MAKTPKPDENVGDKPLAPEAPVVQEREVVNIQSEDEAGTHLSKHYKDSVPDGAKEILVTQDGNVFIDENVVYGHRHAEKFGLKKFLLTR